MFFSVLYLLPVLLSPIVFAQIPTEFSSKFDNESGIELVLSFGANKLIEGEFVPLAETKQTPTFALGDSSPINTNAKYIVVGIDPDAPSRNNPTVAQVLHYLNDNFSPKPGQGTNITSSNKQALMSFRPPGPPKGTGPHRYIWLLYQQPLTGFQIRDVPENRTMFNVTKWAQANGLEPPVTGTYFEAEFDDGRAGNSSSSVSSSPSATQSSAGSPIVSATASATESSPPEQSSSTGAVVGRKGDKVWWILLTVVGAHLGVGVVL